MILIVLATLASILIYYKVIKPHKYWKEQGVPQQWQMPIFGDFYLMTFKIKSFAECVEYFYNLFPNSRYSGIYQFNEPILMLRDPELIKQLTVKDFEHFTDHRQVFPEGAEPLWSRNLFALTGQKWKDMRATLSPSFTSSKMKMMYSLMSDVAENFIEKLVKDSAHIKEREMKDIYTRFANDVIATCAFGINVDSYVNKDNEFYKMGKEITDFSGFWNNIKFSFLLLAPRLSQYLGLKMFSNKARKFFEDLVTSTIKLREEQNLVRPDMINLLMEARKGKVKEDDHHEAETGFATVEESAIGKATSQKKEELTDLDICAQALIFFFAGFDSVSTMMCFMAYELAVNPDIQDKLREEVDETMRECKGKLTYEALLRMKYMDMVVSETLRKWPNAVASDRRCTKPYTLEASNPGEEPIYLPQESTVWVPIFGLHRDPEYYPDPERFDPERFSDDNKGNIKPYTYLPFGVGPRNCIGSRFALLEIKIIFFHLLSKMEILPNASTPIPMKTSKASFALLADPGFFMDLRVRKDKVQDIR